MEGGSTIQSIVRAVQTLSQLLNCSVETATGAVWPGGVAACQGYFFTQAVAGFGPQARGHFLPFRKGNRLVGSEEPGDTDVCKTNYTQSQA